MESKDIKRLKRNIELYRSKDIPHIDWLTTDLLSYLDRLENRIKELEERMRDK